MSSQSCQPERAKKQSSQLHINRCLEERLDSEITVDEVYASPKGEKNTWIQNSFHILEISYLIK